MYTLRLIRSSINACLWLWEPANPIEDYMLWCISNNNLFYILNPHCSRLVALDCVARCNSLCHSVFCVGILVTILALHACQGNPVYICCDVVPVTCRWYLLFVDVELASTFGLYPMIDMYGHKCWWCSWLAGINTGLSITDSSGGGNQICSSTLALFCMYTLEI